MNALRAINPASLFLVAGIAACTVLLTHQPTLGATQPEGNQIAKADDDAIRTVIMGIEETWNTHDMGAMGKLFREDAEWINVVGMHWRGRDDVMTAHAAYHKTMFKNHNVKTDSIEIRSIGEGPAIAVVTTTNDSFTTPDGHVIPKRQDRLTYVLTKRADGWKIVHGHNVPVDADAAQFNPVNAPK